MKMMFEIERRFLLRSAAAAAALCLTPWRAQAERAADPAHLTGPDRTARLIAAHSDWWGRRPNQTRALGCSSSPL